MKKILISIFVLSSFCLKAQPILVKDGKHSAALGLGHISLFNDFETFGENDMATTLSYSYSRDHKYFPLIDFHSFKNKYQTTYFSSSALTMSFGTNFWSLDSFHFSVFGGLGFYLPKATRTINGNVIETESKLVFGTNIGTEAYLKLNNKFSFSMRFHYHNPFDLNQDVGGELEGHYTILSTYLYYHF